MGRFRHKLSGRVWPMPSRLLVGRASTCFLRLESAPVSGEHALLRWADTHWTIRDLGSKNGTRVDHLWLDPQQTAPLKSGAEIELGCPEEIWVLESAAAPDLLALCLDDHSVRVGEHGLLALPSDDDPQATVFIGPDGRWTLDVGTGSLDAAKNELVRVGGQSFRLFLPSAAEGTPMFERALDFDSVDFRFHVSSDEETVDLSVVQHGREKRLETRDYNYLLLCLARARLAERDKPSEEQGWVSAPVLSRMLKKAANALDVATHRARKGLLEAGVTGGQRVVESKRNLRRFGSARIDIRAR